MFTITGSEARFAILLLDPNKVLKIQLINKIVMNNDKCDLKKNNFQISILKKLSLRTIANDCMKLKLREVTRT